MQIENKLLYRSVTLTASRQKMAQMVCLVSAVSNVCELPLFSLVSLHLVAYCRVKYKYAYTSLILHFSSEP